MEAKKDLNNTQRKVLEEVYLEQLKEMHQQYRRDRRDERDKTKDEVLEKLKNKSEFKKLQKAIVNLREAFKDSDKLLAEEGISLYGVEGYRETPSEKAAKIHLGWYSSDADTNKTMQLFDAVTQETERKFASAKNEIRAKIWGLDSSYADIEAEVSAVLASIK